MSNTKVIKIADSSKRIIALIIDYSFVVLLMHSIYPFFLPQGWENMALSEILKSIYPVYFFAFLLIFLKDSVGGKSPGKRFASLRIIHTDEQRSTPNWFTLLKRNLFLTLLPLELYKLVFSKYCRRLGDEKTNTIVIEDTSTTALRNMVVKISGLVFTACFFWFLTNLSMPFGIRKTEVYKRGTEILYRDPEVQKKIGNSFEVGLWSSLEFFNKGISLQLHLKTPDNSQDVELTFEKTQESYQFRKIHFI